MSEVYTPEPWKADRCCVLDANGRAVAATATYERVREGSAQPNADRIALCVNALAGLPAARLAALRPGEAAHWLEVGPRLLEACKAAHNELTKLGFWCNGDCNICIALSQVERLIKGGSHAVH